MNYEFKHLTFLMNRVLRKDKLSNEDYIFLTEMRKHLAIASMQLAKIDKMMDKIVQYC